MSPAALKLATLLLCLIQVTVGIDVEWNSTDSVKRAASTMVFDMMTWYQGNLTGFKPGVLPPPYYWWESGAMWGSLINYWHITGDSTYNEVVSQGMQYQVGEFNDYMPQEHKSSLGNDDQAFWGMAAMQAVETKFPDPPPDKPSWLGLVQAVFNEQVGRWDTSNCGGGLRWQIYKKGGYELKNTISNGCFFNLAARLARYTGQEKYSQWAEKAWDWMWAVGFIGQEENMEYDVYDNAEADALNCTKLNKIQWSYNPAVILLGAATMYNITESEVWKNRTISLLQRMDEVFFPNAIATELCEFHKVCNTDQLSFKAYVGRWMTATTQMAPFTYDKIYPLLLNSAKEAARGCIGGARGSLCGQQWTLNGTWDPVPGKKPEHWSGNGGVGQQMSAMEFTVGTLIKKSGDDKVHIKPPVTDKTGGTSKPDENAGHDTTAKDIIEIVPATRADKVEAWILTVIVLIMCLLGTWFLWSDVLEDRTASNKSAAAAGKAAGKSKVLEVLQLKGAKVAEMIPKYRGGDQVT